MKMTKAEWRYLQKTALDHPYFDTHKLPLTDSEAMAIVEANNAMTGREFVDSVYQKLGKTRPVEKNKRFDTLRGIAELFTVPSIRKIAVAVVAAILLAIFFAATPAGRAIAESMVRYTIRLFDKGLSAVSRESYEENVFINDADVPGSRVEDRWCAKAIDGFESFESATGVSPFVLPLHCTEVVYEQFEIPILIASYDAPQGTVTAYQIWNAEDFSCKATADFSVCASDDSVYYSVDPNDGSIICIKALEDSVVMIYAEGAFDIDDLLMMLTDRNKGL